MGKRFKLRIFRVIAFTFQSCRSKDDVYLPCDPFSSCSRHSSQHNRRRSSRKRQPQSALMSTACGRLSDCVKRSEEAVDSSDLPEKFGNEEKWLFVGSVCPQTTPLLENYSPYVSSDDSELEESLVFANPGSAPLPPPPCSAAERKKTACMKKKKRNMIPDRLRTSASSDDSGWLSSEREEEENNGTLVSSVSFSTESSSETKPYFRRPSKRSTGRAFSNPAAEGEVPARLSVMEKKIPFSAAGKVKESFAIVKNSEDPLQDFKNSMADMIVEKQIFEHRDLEQLLQCFLSLNSRHYHEVIVQAFFETWENVFSPQGLKALSDRNRRRRLHRGAV